MSICYKIAAYQGVTSTEAGLTIAADGGRTMADAQHARATNSAQEITCKECRETKPVSAYYASNRSSCKECVKAAVRANRAAKADYYRAYDRVRYRNDPARREHCIAMGRTVPMAERVRKQRERRRAEPEKNAARLRLKRAVDKGQLTRKPCYFCGMAGRTEAHHPDYSHPLDVFWLCSGCHGKLHTINGDFLRRV